MRGNYFVQELGFITKQGVFVCAHCAYEAERQGGAHPHTVAAGYKRIVFLSDLADDEQAGVVHVCPYCGTVAVLRKE